MSSKGDIAGLAQTCRNLYDLIMPELYRLSFQEKATDTLYWAAEHGHSRVVQSFLIANSHLGLQLLLPHMNRALSLSAKHGQTSVVSTLLLIEGVDPDSTSNRFQRTPLSYAAQGAYVDIVRSLLEANRVNPNSIDRQYGQLPLIWAVQYRLGEVDLKSEAAASAVQSAEERAIPVIRLLLNNGANIKSIDYDYRNALYWATANSMGLSAIVCLLLQKGALPEGNVDDKQQAMAKSRQSYRIPRPEIRLPLSFEGWAGYDEVIQTLLEFKANMDCMELFGSFRNRHPLACVAEKGNLSTVRLLINQGACPESPGCPLRCAAKNGHVEMVQLLLDEMMHHYSRITDARQRGKEEEGTRICTRYYRNHSPGNTAIAALPDAMESGNVEVVRLLLTVSRVDINHGYLTGANIPLLITVRAEQPSIDMIKVLLAI
ncbi:hypothetical protein V491_05718 [Pseudogymnoascus sp. VKM F-3775]|nr:hypothetical protein V491_05718 [Pseudogymnoascus sp. VKM F-3775]